jgi:hypothetical protein
LSADENGGIRSQVFSGLWLAGDDLLTGNRGRVLAVLLRRVGGTRTYRICEPVTSSEVMGKGCDRLFCQHGT